MFRRMWKAVETKAREIRIAKAERKKEERKREKCYDLSYVLSKKHTLVLSNMRELNRVPKYKCLPYIQNTDGLCYTSLALP